MLGCSFAALSGVLVAPLLGVDAVLLTLLVIQAFGAAGLTDDFRLPEMYATARWISIADGPDEVHNRAIARLELRKYANAPVH